MFNTKNEELRQQAESYVSSISSSLSSSSTTATSNSINELIAAFEAGFALKLTGALESTGGLKSTGALKSTDGDNLKGYNKLKQATLRDLLKDQSKVNEPYVVIMAPEGIETYTRQQLADEVKGETEQGIKIFRMLMNLTADMLLRQKI